MDRYIQDPDFRKMEDSLVAVAFDSARILRMSERVSGRIPWPLSVIVKLPFIISTDISIVVAVASMPEIISNYYYERDEMDNSEVVRDIYQIFGE